MIRPEPATRHVVHRCPRCGVEHDTSTDAGPVCAACDTPLRPWCRAHSREIGWLDGSVCGRCAGEAARPTPRPRAAMAGLPCPDFSRDAAGAVRPAARADLPADAAEPPKPLAPVERRAVMLLIMLMRTGGGTMLGVIAGFLFVVTGRGSLPDAALRFALGGAVLGLLVGALSCVRYLKAIRAR